MGLILCGVLLVGFYLIKLIYPEFIIGVAQSKSIVAFGTYIDNHKWAYYIFDSSVAFLSACVYCGACCRKYKLSWKDLLIIAVWITILNIVFAIIPQHYTHINYILLISAPFVCCVLNNTVNKECFISTCICFCCDILLQLISMSIRDLTSLAVQFNSATFCILLIDGYIWRFLLYFYFNYKGDK
jgi:hypothetical protein